MSASLKSRLWWLGLVSSLSILFLASFTLWQTERSKDKMIHFIDDEIATSQLAGRIYADGLQMGQALRNILLDPTNKKGYENHANAKQAFSDKLTRLTALFVPHAEKIEVSQRLNNTAAQWHPIQERVIELAKAGNVSEARELLVREETPTWRTLRGDLLEQVKLADQEAELRRTELLDHLALARNIALVFSLLSFAAVAALTSVIGRSVYQQVGGEPAAVADALKHIAHGDLTTHIPLARGDQASIVAAVSTMQSEVKQLIQQTKASADAVVSSSHAIQAETSRLEDIAQDQSTSATAIAAAVEELTVSISVMSDSANDAHRLAESGNHQGQEGLAAVAEASGTIGRIADAMVQASSTMDELSGKVGSIDSIVQTIRDIADQTNLLALNAAIEAARAGEQGRGFAVVADEVRKLAERTTASTQEISEIVTGICRTSETARNTMSAAKNQALDGSEKTQKVSEVVQDIVDAATQVGVAIESIATGLRQQSAASDDIAKRLEVIAQGIEQTHQASATASEHTHAMAQLSQNLKGNMQKFTV